MAAVILGGQFVVNGTPSSVNTICATLIAVGVIISSVTFNPINAGQTKHTIEVKDLSSLSGLS